jgi:hypothetical protein
MAANCQGESVMLRRGMIVGLGLAFAVAASAAMDRAAAQPNEPPPRPSGPPQSKPLPRPKILQANLADRHVTSGNGLHNGQDGTLYLDGQVTAGKPVPRPGSQSSQAPCRAVWPAPCQAARL